MPHRSYLSILYDHYPTGVMIADDRAYYVDANRAACELLGRRRDELIGHHLSEIVAPSRRIEVDLQWQSFLRDGEQQGLFEVTLSDGTTRQLQFIARANFAPGLHCSFLSPAPSRATAAGNADEALVVCAWTKRVRYRGEWMALEEYLLIAHGQFVTHGMSPEAFRTMSEGE